MMTCEASKLQAMSLENRLKRKARKCWRTAPGQNLSLDDMEL